MLWQLRLNICKCLCPSESRLAAVATLQLGDCVFCVRHSCVCARLVVAQIRRVLLRTNLLVDCFRQVYLACIARHLYIGARHFASWTVADAKQIDNQLVQQFARPTVWRPSLCDDSVCAWQRLGRRCHFVRGCSLYWPFSIGTSL